MRLLPSTYALPALLLISLANALLLFVHRVMTNGDNLDYLMIAGAVNAGHWAEPFHWRFPVGYPYWLAFLSWLGGGVIGINPLSVSSAAIYGFKLAGVVMAPLAVAAVYGWARTVAVSPAAALLIALLMATTQVWAPVYSIIGAEPYFLVLVWLALWGWEKVLVATDNAQHSTSNVQRSSDDIRRLQTRLKKERSVWLAMACGTSLAALMFRQLGLAIPLAVMAAMIGRAILDGKGMDWRPLAGAIAVGLAGVLLMMLNTSHLDQLAGAGADKQNYLSAKWALLCANVESYRMTIPHLLLPKVLGEQGVMGKLGLGWLGTVAACMLGVLLLAGLWRSFLERRAGLVSALFVVINIGIILVWPYRDARFFVPLLPALWFLVMRGAAWLGSIMPVAAIRRPGWAIAAILVLAAWQQATTGFAGTKNIRAITAFQELPAWHPERYDITGELDFSDHLACGLWLAEHAEEDAVVFGEKAAFIELASRRHAHYLGMGLADGTLLSQSLSGTTEVFVVADVFPESAGYGRAKAAFRDWMSRPDVPQFEPVYRAPHGATVYRAIK